MCGSTPSSSASGLSDSGLSDAGWGGNGRAVSFDHLFCPALTAGSRRAAAGGQRRSQIYDEIGGQRRFQRAGIYYY
eukprot:5340663-Pyramimonas_sp.AAC.1